MESLASWVAPVATTIAALMTASNLGSRVTGWGFAVFLIGSIAWGTLGVVTDQPNLVWQNAILSALNIFGMWRWLGRQQQIEEGAGKAAAASQAAPSETLFPASQLSSAEVTANDGASLGKAVDAMVGCASGRIAYVVVAEGGVAGVGETLRRVDWDQLAADADGLTAHFATPAFANLPKLERDRWPAR
ncbi:PRC-barrel domain-containing protein [Sphingomonas mesophila]|uniref:PRC-barrel domain-containing protein n=1 Tax=Sphingomonas mesophila TaxID=2303576 RepID=UPI000E593349|nr:PRC-barrel domain-containing protein [Sphingomonas mesophila]